MPRKTNKNDTTVPTKSRLAPAAERALAEADERRKAVARKSQTKSQTKIDETGGRDGPEPTRYGDWEKDGIVSDF